MLTTEDIRIVKSTIPLLVEGGSAITQHFYQRMFKHNPELNDIFNMSNQHTGRQIEALFQAIAAYAQNIDNLGALKHMVERIAQKHTSFHIQPEHYDIVGHHLIETLRELLTTQFTAEIEAAWTNAYGVLANIFIQREEQIYSQTAAAKGGWRGKRAFALVEKKKESELVTSFVFEPIDQQAVVGYQPGQYLGIELTPKDAQYKEIRQYSLSDKANGKSYRISVKREVANAQSPQGLISNYLHDHLQVGDLVDLHAPAGDFFLDGDSLQTNTPVVLVSAGVGVTPMQAMLESLSELAEQNDNILPEVHYLHACINPEQHSFKMRSRELCNHNNWSLKTWYEQNEVYNSDEVEQVNTGFIDFANSNLPLSAAAFYLCGPVNFMKFCKKSLLELGVAEDRIHYEVFGPHEGL